MKKGRAFARQLRSTMTDAEQQLWMRLKSQQVYGLKFRRQYVMGYHIVDFICLSRKLIIEIDGGQHAKSQTQDKQRDEWFRKKGFRVLRIWNHDVLGNLEGVLQVVESHVREPHPPPPL